MQPACLSSVRISDQVFFSYLLKKKIQGNSAGREMKCVFRFKCNCLLVYNFVTCLSVFEILNARERTRIIVLVHLQSMSAKYTVFRSCSVHYIIENSHQEFSHFSINSAELYPLLRGADKSLARSISRCILFDGENISFDASLVIYINSTNIPPIMIINRIYETQNLLSLQLVSVLVGLRTFQHPCIYRVLISPQPDLFPGVFFMVRIFRLMLVLL